MRKPILARLNGCQLGSNADDRADQGPSRPRFLNLGKTVATGGLRSVGTPRQTPRHMRFIRDIHSERQAGSRPVISFEFFPPKTEEGDRNLFEKTLPGLMDLKPDYCSVTYGAGGSTREKTLAIASRIQDEHHLTALMHLTCVNATLDEIRAVATEAHARGIRNLLALRGDPPGGTGEFKATEGGFEYSHQLVGFLHEMGGFSIGTAGFPEGHIACMEGREVDWQRLKAKIDRGADFVVTQLFFDNADFFRFRDYLAKLGVTVPLTAGILPILGSGQVQRFCQLCGATIPAALKAQLDKLAGDDEACARFGVEYATRQCEDLMREGVPGLHFYTLNKVPSTTSVVKNLGLA
jgi:methylenetetrahydrofolate reductase (NADPH)